MSMFFLHWSHMKETLQESLNTFVFLPRSRIQVALRVKTMQTLMSWMIFLNPPH